MPPLLWTGKGPGPWLFPDTRVSIRSSSDCLLLVLLAFYSEMKEVFLTALCHLRGQ